MSRDRAHSAWKSAESIKKLSDRVVGIGPFSIGLDGILTWIPGAGIVYTAGASAYLLYLAANAKASFGTMAKMAGVLGVDLLLSDLPIPGLADLFDMFWQGHLMAANALQKDIEGRHGAPADRLAAVERERRRRGRGLGWIVLLLFVIFGLAVWRSDFGESLHLGWWEAFKSASLPLLGYSVSLPLLTGVFVALVFLTNAANRVRRPA